MSLLSHSEKKHSTENRLQFLDALRGIAALYVVLFHMVLVPDFKIPFPDYLHGFLMNGGSGVTLFFVISAFTLCLTMHGKKLNNLTIKQFYIRRFLRIAPLYYAWLLIIIFFYKQPVNFNQLFLYSTFTFNFFPFKQEGIVWASWTLGIEMVFYFLFPFIFRYINTLRKSILFFLVSVILMVVHYNYTKDIDGYKAQMGFLNQLPVFALGFIVFFVYEKIKHKTFSKIYGFTLILFSLSLFSFHALLFSSLGFAAFLAKAIAYCILFFGLYISPIKLLVNKLTVFAGTISFSLYLNHSKIVFALSPIYQKISENIASNELSLIVCFLLTLIIAVPISYITYLIIEKPSIQLARRIIQNNWLSSYFEKSKK